MRVEVRKPEIAVVPAGAVNDMDNERAEINGDSVQLHLGLASTDGGGIDAEQPLFGWLVVPALPQAGAA